MKRLTERVVESEAKKVDLDKFKEDIHNFVKNIESQSLRHQEQIQRKLNDRFEKFTSIHEKLMNESGRHQIDIQILKDEVSSNKIEIGNHINRLDNVEE